MCSLYTNSVILNLGEIETKIAKIITLLSWVHFFASMKKKDFQTEHGN